MLQVDDHRSYLSDVYPSVLLIEDDPATRWLVRAALRDECTLSTVTSVDNYMIKYKALNKYMSLMPDIVFLDIELPPSSGKDILVNMLRADPKAYVVMFSSHDTEDNIRESLESGARGFIAKPFNKSIMLDYISDAFLNKSR